MKFAATVLTLLALVASLTAHKLPVAGSGELAQDLQVTWSSLDVEQSPELDAFVKDIEASSEFAALADFVQGGLNETLARCSSYTKDMSETETTGGLAGSAKDSGAPGPAGKPQPRKFCIRIKIRVCI
ncbi:uncharacterized protein LOC143357061 [Halictus rubicundus]|uniref:uncharacterized protein LOC143357061 n=1 Tax=Halictus rubicundus TaxID=77578 RepID=UPI004036703A